MLSRREEHRTAARKVEAGGEPGSAETILVVDDDKSMRDLTRELLQEAGYNVIQAAGGVEALLVSLKHHGTIDLLLTDVIMPHMDGPELAQRFADRRPETRILFMSGFNAEALGPSWICTDEIRLLAKPFSEDDLMRQVRATMDADLIEQREP